MEFVSSLCTKSDIFFSFYHVSTGAMGCMIELLLGMARVKVNGVIMYLWELQYFLQSFHIILIPEGND